MPSPKTTTVVPAPSAVQLVSTQTETVITYDRPDGWHTRCVTTDIADKERGTEVHEVVMDSTRDAVADETGAMVHEHVTKGIRDTIDAPAHVHTHVETVTGERDTEGAKKHEVLHARCGTIEADDYRSTETAEDYKCTQEGGVELLESAVSEDQVVGQEKDMLAHQLKAFGDTPLEKRLVSSKKTTVVTCDRPDGWHLRRVVTDSLEDESGKQTREVVTDGVRDVVVGGEVIHEHVTKGIRDTVNLRTQERMHVEILNRERDGDEALHHKHETLHLTSGDVTAPGYQSTVTTTDYICDEETTIPGEDEYSPENKAPAIPENSDNKENQPPAVSEE